ncbi:MAG: hypothetical protein HQRvContig01_2 [Haloquadratum phage sp.]|nr:MAG: hypothetical protein HQRvContig01_2 [Haloquadratum phage sp.]
MHGWGKIRDTAESWGWKRQRAFGFDSRAVHCREVRTKWIDLPLQIGREAALRAGSSVRENIGLSSVVVIERGRENRKVDRVQFSNKTLEAAK